MNFKVPAKDSEGRDVFIKPEYYIEEIDGAKHLVKNKDRGNPEMLEFFVISALFAMSDKIDERGNHILDGPARMEIFELCKKVKAPNKDKKFSRSELEKIKEATGKYLNSTQIMGQIWEMIEKELTAEKEK